MRRIVALVAGLAILVLANHSIYSRERLLAEGRVVLLELAPVDPRSLMQGDYMALQFAVANSARDALQRPAREDPLRIDLPPSDGRMVATVDEKGVATYRRLDDGQPLAADEIHLRYRVRHGEIKFATNAFFFEEGTAARYGNARYGEFRVGDDGEMILTGLRGSRLEPLKP